MTSSAWAEKGGEKKIRKWLKENQIQVKEAKNRGSRKQEEPQRGNGNGNRKGEQKG